MILQQAQLVTSALPIEPTPECSEGPSHFEFCRVIINETRRIKSHKTIISYAQRLVSMKFRDKTVK